MSRHRGQPTGAPERFSRWPALLAVLLAGVLTAGIAALPTISSAAPARAAASAAPEQPVEPPPPAVPKPFGKLTCVSEYGIRFCPGGLLPDGQDLRIPSFDGVPLDADVALPATGKGPFPLIVLLHGLAENKTVYEVTRDDGGLDDVSMAERGYAVLMYTARGFGNSCGTKASRVNTPACAKGWIHLADQRYEIRDTQYLAGRLVDEGLVRPDIAVAGISYGAGQTLELTALKNRIRLPDGRFAPFVSPRRHVPMAVAAGFAMWPWDDLITSLVPNGNLTTTGTATAADDRNPVGVAKQSWIALLYSASNVFFVAPVGADRQADLTTWDHELLDQGEPYSAKAAEGLQIVQEYKSAIGIPPAPGGPAPTVIMSGWTDSLFPATEALHYDHQAAAAGGHTPVLTVLADIGHGWARNSPVDTQTGETLAFGFLGDEMLTHTHPRTGLVALAETCSPSGVGAPEITGPDLPSLATGTLTFSGGATQVVTSAGGNPSVAEATDPTTGKKCAPESLVTGPGVATWTSSDTTPAGGASSTGNITEIGSVSVSATLHITGHAPELAATLWDVDPGVGRTVVAYGIYRPAVDQGPFTGSGAATVHAHFELDPTFYTFAAGHYAQLELSGADAPYFRTSNGTFTITVTGAKVTVPTRNSPTP